MDEDEARQEGRAWGKAAAVSALELLEVADDEKEREALMRALWQLIAEATDQAVQRSGTEYGAAFLAAAQAELDSILQVREGRPDGRRLH